MKYKYPQIKCRFYVDEDYKTGKGYLIAKINVVPIYLVDTGYMDEDFHGWLFKKCVFSAHEAEKLIGLEKPYNVEVKMQGCFFIERSEADIMRKALEGT